MTTPAAEHLFRVSPDGERVLLDKARSTAFHRALDQLLFITPRDRIDIQTTIVFLTTRVRELVEDDWGNMKRILQYIFCMVYMPLILRADSLTIIKRCVYASYAMH